MQSAVILEALNETEFDRNWQQKVKEKEMSLSAKKVLELSKQLLNREGLLLNRIKKLERDT